MPSAQPTTIPQLLGHDGSNCAAPFPDRIFACDAPDPPLLHAPDPLLPQIATATASAAADACASGGGSASASSTAISQAVVSVCLWAGGYTYRAGCGELRALEVTLTVESGKWVGGRRLAGLVRGLIRGLVRGLVRGLGRGTWT